MTTFKGHCLSWIRVVPAKIGRPLDENYLRQWIPLIKERAKTLAEIPQLGLFFYEESFDYPPADLVIRGDHQLTYDIFLKIQKLAEMTPFNKEALEKDFRALAAQLGLKAGELFNAMRTAVTGRTVSPPLFETMVAMGQERVLNHIREAMDKLLSMPK